MFQIDNASAAAAAPPKKPTGIPGYFTPGSIGGVEATILEADWLNIVQTEILNVLAAAGISPDKSNDAQLIAAILALIAAKPNQALPGSAARLSATLNTNGSAVSFTADYLTLISGAAGIVLAGFNAHLDVTTIGAGGMDIGAAPASAFLSIYAIYNPTTQTAALLATTAGQTTTYTGSHMPAGYVHSALIAIWPTDASHLLIAGAVVDRTFYYLNPTPRGALSNGTATAVTAVSLSAFVPAAAREVLLVGAVAEVAAIDGSSAALFVPTSIAGTYAIEVTPANLSLATYIYFTFPLITPQTVYYRSGKSTSQSSLNVNGYII